MKIRLFIYTSLFSIPALFLASCSDSSVEVQNVPNRGHQEPALYSNAVIEAVDSMVARDTTIPDDKKDEIVEKITKEYLMGQFDPEKDDRFAEVPPSLTKKDYAIFMRKEALESFQAMEAAAKKDGVTLRIMSATRPFNIQKSIWERKWTGKRKTGGKFVPQDISDMDKTMLVLRWSAMPSTSRHHWGTDIDINSVEPAYFDKSPGKEEYAWLIEHGPSFGFCQVYSPKGEGGRPYGYEEEKWHWSYLPVANELLKAYAEQITDEDIAGFVGSETAIDIEVVKKYVMGINQDCLPQ